MMYSVIIPTLNEERLVGHAIASVLSQTIKPDEVIVVDCGSKDATVDIAKRMGARVIKVNKCNPGYQRDVGVLSARNDLILSLDADTVLSPNFVEKSLPLVKPGVAVTGKFRPLNDSIPARINLFIRELFPIDFRNPGILLFKKKRPWKMYFSQPLKGKWKDIQNFKMQYKIVQGPGIIYTEIPPEQSFLTSMGLGLLIGYVIKKVR